MSTGMRDAETGRLGLTAEELLEAAPQAFFALDRAWRFRYLNPAAERLLERDADDLLGIDVWEAFPRARGMAFHAEYQRAMRDGVVVQFTEHYPPLRRWFAVQAVPQPHGLSVYFHDVTACKDAERRAAAEAEGHATLRTIAGAVAAEAPPELVLELVRRESADLAGADGAWILRWRPDDGLRLPERVVARVRAGASVVAADGLDGRAGDVRLRAGVLVPIHLHGVVWGALAVAWEAPRPDAEAGERWLRELAELVAVAVGNAESRAATAPPAPRPIDGAVDFTALHGLGLPVLGVDRRRRLAFCNPAAEALFGWPADELVGRPADRLGLLDAASLDAIEAALRGTGAWTGEAVGITKAGRRFPAAVATAVLRDPGGAAAGVVATILDLAGHRPDPPAGWEQELRAEREGRGWAPRLREAIDAERFEVHAQPIVDARSGEVLDHELLLRLRDDDGVLVAPCAFLPAAERHGLITEIDGWVLEEAVRHATRGMRLHVNLSARSIGDVGVLARLRRALERTETPADRLTVELTETALLADRDRAGAFARHLQRIGCHVALDDFGAGYNSFARIKDIPADVVKIDRQFVCDVLTDAGSASVVRAIVAFAAGLGAVVVAEGVEDEPTRRRLVELGVDRAQGWLFGRPEPL